MDYTLPMDELDCPDQSFQQLVGALLVERIGPLADALRVTGGDGVANWHRGSLARSKARAGQRSSN